MRGDKGSLAGRRVDQRAAKVGTTHGRVRWAGGVRFADHVRTTGGDHEGQREGEGVERALATIAGRAVAAKKSDNPANERVGARLLFEKSR